ncbi:restriction endonuclease subunit S [Vibrio parahaemolyticus]|nr:restriction endonuclease subunit S [Vibrio parahaemolyticus]EJK2425267.1 restriction endonuclease subunit S [Vibrio parahaemolyticus]
MSSGVAEVNPQYLAEMDSSAIPVGYKQTEVGVIPEDWGVVPIGSLCTIFGRIGFRGYTKADIVDEDQGVLSISPSNIFQGTVNFDHGTYISWSKYHESPEIQIFNGDVLLVKTGSTYGKVGLVNSLEREATLNPQVVVLKKIKCPSPLLAYVMQFELVQNQIEETIVGGAIPTLSQKAVANYLVPIPIKQHEQTAIANALSDVDSLITSLTKLIAKKQAIKTATMQQLLTGRTRLPQFALREDGIPKGTKTSELGEIPEDWEVVTLGDIAEVRMCKRILSYQTAKNGEIPFFKIGTFGGEPDAYISKSLYRDFKAKFSYPEKGDVLISAAGTLGKMVVYDGRPSYFQDSNIVWLEIDKRKISNEYLYQYYKVIKWASSEGSTISRLYNGIIKASVIGIPSLAEQTAIATILSDMDEEIQALKQRLGKTRQIKQGMMQELLTGKTRLIKPSKEVIHE